MAHQADLIKIGIDGFAIIDEYFGRRVAKPYTPQKPRAPQNHAPVVQRNLPAKGPQPFNHYTYQLQEYHVYHTTRVSSSEATVITGNETALLHDGKAFMDFSRRRPTGMAF